MRTNTPEAFFKASVVQSCFMACGRCGEVVTANWPVITWQWALGLPRMSWYEFKTGKSKPVLLLPARGDWRRDVLLILGFAAATGQFNLGGPAVGSSAKSLFHQLDELEGDGAVASKITGILRDLTPGSGSTADNAGLAAAALTGGNYTSRSIRYGAIAETEAHAVRQPNVTDLSGHAPSSVSERNGGVGSGSAFDSYHIVSDKSVVLGESKIVYANACAVYPLLKYAPRNDLPLRLLLPIFFSAAMGLTGWPVPPGGELTGGAPQPPSLACLRVLLPEQDMPKLEKLMDIMYLLERDITPELVQGGRLRVFVECWLASHLRYWSQLKLLFPASVVNENLRRAVILSGIAANVPTAADAFLDKVGSAVAEAFEAANIGLTATGVGGMQAVAAHQTALSTQLAALMGVVTQQGVRVEGCLNQLGERVTSLQGVTSGLQAQLARLPSGQPAVILAAGTNANVSPSRRSTGSSSSSGGGSSSSSSSSSSRSIVSKLVPVRPLAAPVTVFTSSTIAAIVAQLARVSISCEPLAKNLGPGGPRTNLDSITWSLLLKATAALKALADPEEKGIWEKSFRSSAGEGAGAVPGEGAGAVPGAPSFLVILLELESRLAVRLDNEELRLTNKVTASRNMTLNAFEARLKKMRKVDANVDTLFRSAPDDLISLITSVRAKNTEAKPAAKKRKRGNLGESAAGAARHTSSATAVGNGRSGKQTTKSSALPPPLANDFFGRSGLSSSSSSSTSSASNAGESAEGR
jgi:hypothetical protein